MISHVDGTGRRRIRSSGTTDKRAAERLAGKLETQAMLAREGVVDPRAERFAAAARKPLREHLDDFLQHLRDRGATKQHADDRKGQLGRLVEAMGATRLADLTPARVSRALAKVRSERGVALRTLNRYQVAIKSLSKWLVCESRLESDPLFAMRGFNAETDRRRRRRALTADELAKLVRAAERGPTVQGLSGPDRAALYRIAAGTGFRASEIASLKRSSFRLDESPPVVVVAAGYSKNRRESVQPIRRDLAEFLAGWLAGKPEGLPVFDILRLRDKTGKMVRRDLASAKVPRLLDGQVVDFHAIRHTFISDLVRSGATVKQAQVLARHASPDLTLRVYSHVQAEDLERALEALPATVGAGEGSCVSGGKPGVPAPDAATSDSSDHRPRALDEAV